MSKRSIDEVEDADFKEMFIKNKEAKLEGSRIEYVVTNIISNNRIKLRRFFTESKINELIPFSAEMEKGALSQIINKYQNLMDYYDDINDHESYCRFETLYNDTITLILRSVPIHLDLSVNRISIPMPYGCFYASLTQLRTAYLNNKCPELMYFTEVEYQMHSKTKWKFDRPYVHYFYLEDTVSPSHKDYNSLDTKYLDVFETFFTMYKWLTNKTVYKHNLGLNIDVDRFKVYIKMGELISEDLYPSTGTLILE
jgi:hypothetical protein